MASKVQICNRALSSHLGCKRINSLTESTPEAEQCNLHYEDTLRALLEAYPWSFAQRQDALAEVTNDLSDFWDYAYQRPANCLRIAWVNDDQSARDYMALNRDPDTDRRTIGDTIYSNVPAASISYTTFVDDPAEYSQAFRDALSAAIAANMAMPLTENSRLAGRAMEMAERSLDMAVAHDESQKRTEEAALIPDWLRDRGVS